MIFSQEDLQVVFKEGVSLGERRITYSDLELLSVLPETALVREDRYNLQL